jgi:hypothetical protein
MVVSQVWVGLSGCAVEELVYGDRFGTMSLVATLGL